MVGIVGGDFHLAGLTEGGQLSPCICRRLGPTVYSLPQAERDAATIDSINAVSIAAMLAVSRPCDPADGDNLIVKFSQVQHGA